MPTLILISLFSSILANGYSQGKFLKNESCKDCKITVVVFIGLDCPISQKYIGKLNSLYEQYRPRVELLGYVPQNVSNGTIRKFIDEYGVKFSLKKDNELNMARRVTAIVTPEVFVYRAGDFSKNELYVYRGAIDNWFYELGRYRQQVTEHYLIDAIESLLKKEEPKIKQTKAIGCFIEMSLEKQDEHHHH